MNTKSKLPPKPWGLVDPNGAGSGYRPIHICDAAGVNFLYVGNAGKEPAVLEIARHLIGRCNPP